MTQQPGVLQARRHGRTTRARALARVDDRQHESELSAAGERRRRNLAMRRERQLLRIFSAWVRRNGPDVSSTGTLDAQRHCFGGAHRYVDCRRPGLVQLHSATIPAMTLKALVVVGALSAFSSTASRGLAQPAPSRDVRLERFEQWLGALLHHSPGFVDDEIVVVGKQSNAELQVLFVDATTVIRILRNPNLASESAGVPISVPSGRAGQTPRPVPYTPREISRLKQIGCAVGGFLEARPCEWTKLEVARDAVLSSLSSAATAVRRDMNANFIVRRAGLMHTDVAMLGLTAPSAPICRRVSNPLVCRSLTVIRVD